MVLPHCEMPFKFDSLSRIRNVLSTIRVVRCFSCKMPRLFKQEKIRRLRLESVSTTESDIEFLRFKSDNELYLAKTQICDVCKRYQERSGTCPAINVWHVASTGTADRSVSSPASLPLRSVAGKFVSSLAADGFHAPRPPSQDW